jgi:hypothetical protein
MVLRKHLLLSRLASFYLLASLTCGAAEPTDEREASMLYSRANDAVSNISESAYSYAYIQFYWRRAQANIDRILRVYPETETGRKLAAGSLKIGAYDLNYFRERLLPRLEEKRLAAFDAVNNAIFLYNRERPGIDAEKTAAFESIVEVLSAQRRWSEALGFPLLNDDRGLLIATVFRVAARLDNSPLVAELLANTTPSEQTRLWPILGEAYALVGRPRSDITKLLDEHPGEEVRLAVLAGMVEREIRIQRVAALRLPPSDEIRTVHYTLKSLDVRDDIESVARTFFPTPNAAATSLVERYRAAQGSKPASPAASVAHAAFIDYAADLGKFEELTAYANARTLPKVVAQTLVQAYHRAGRFDDGKAVQSRLVAAKVLTLDEAELAAFRGRIESSEVPLTVRPTTFSSLAIQDPCVLAVALMDWSLTPNRSIRGAAPLDSVVYRYQPGFENLPLPLSKEVGEASATERPF